MHARPIQDLFLNTLFYHRHQCPSWWNTGAYSRTFTPRHNYLGDNGAQDGGQPCLGLGVWGTFYRGVVLYKNLMA